MPEIIKTMKLKLYTDKNSNELFCQLTKRYAGACNFISQYVFDNGFILNFMELQKQLYQTIRSQYGLKSQTTISAFKTVTARYKAVKEQLFQSPFRYKDENEDENVYYAARALEWLWNPICFKRPQADLVRNRDYSFVDGRQKLSVNTLGKRVCVKFAIPKCFDKFFNPDEGWSFGTGKLVKLKGRWYFHIPMTKTVPDTFDNKKPAHIVGIDRGLRFLTTTYDEKGKTCFISGKKIAAKRDMFNRVRAELQFKGTKSAKRVLKRLSGRENRWMSDVNHQISKTLVQKYRQNTLFVIEDLTGVSFDQENLSHGNAKQRNQRRTWAFCQFEMFLKYKAMAAGADVLKVPANYTSQRCPKCGRIHKANRNHKTHEYICDACGYRSNDDLNIYALGTLFVSGDNNLRFGARKIK